MRELLSSPANIEAVPCDSAVIVKWSAVEGADGYIMYFYSAEDSEKCIKRRYAKRLSKKILGFTNGMNYSVEVRAFYYKDGAEIIGKASEKADFSPISNTLKAQKVMCLSLSETQQIEWEYKNTRPEAEFECDDESIAVVDRKGVVRAVRTGTAHITIYSAGQKFTVTVYVNREITEKPSKAVMLFTGDLMCAVKHQSVCAKRGFDFNDSFNEVRELFKEADLVTGVLETSCYDGAPYEFEQLRLESGAPNCNSPSSFITAASEAGFDVLVTANNHNCDTGGAGIVTTSGNINRFGMVPVGTLNSNPVMCTVKGFRVAIIALNSISNGQEYRTNGLDENALGKYSRESLGDLVDAARNNGAEFVVVYLHWGAMNSSAITSSQIEEARFIAESDVDLIIGSHPHVLQPFRQIRTSDNRLVPCAFSLGNFITSQSEMEENRESIILRTELIRGKEETKLHISYIPCISVDSYCGVTVKLLENPYDDATEKSVARIKETIGKSIDTNSYRPKVLISGSVILDKIFASKSIAQLDRSALLLSQLTACGELNEVDVPNPFLRLDLTKDFPYYAKECGADYIAVDFYAAAAISCYRLGKNIYTGTKRFLKSEFYLEHKSEFERIKPPFAADFWKPLVKEYAEAVLEAFPSEKIILFREKFSDHLIKGGTELRNASVRGSLNKQIAEMEQYFITLTNPNIVNISQYYYNMGGSPSNYEPAYFIDACNAAYDIIYNNRRYIDTPDLDLWYDRMLSCYENMIARGYQSWFLDMKKASDIIIAYTNKAFAAENRERLLMLKISGSESLSGVSLFFKGDRGAKPIIEAAEIISAVLSGDTAKPYDFYAPVFDNKYNIIKKLIKVVSAETKVSLNDETVEKAMLLKNRPDQLMGFVFQLRERSVDIWGSCVSREVLNHCSKSSIGEYIFKQCPVLAYDNPVPAEIPEDVSLFDGNGWRRRALKSSFERDGMEKLKADNSNWIVVDFYDVICEMASYKDGLFEIDDFIKRTGFYNSIKSECKPGNLFEYRTKEECSSAITRFSWDLTNIYGDNIILIRVEPKDSYITLDDRLGKMPSDFHFRRKCDLISFCETQFMRQTGCYVINLSKHFYASDKFPLGGSHVVHYEQEFYREAGIYLNHILSGSKVKRFEKPDEKYLSLRDLKLER
ncbi:MAG: CapA family protein [Ruminiclostridium sp.]|nr:CapA family protein [Ruminiclostridium sp.]